MSRAARQLEARRQQALLVQLEAPFRRAMAAEIERATREMVRVWELTGEVPTQADHLANIEALFAPMAVDATTVFGGRVLRAAKRAGQVLERKDFATTMAQIALRYISLEAVRRRIVQIAETTRSQIVSAVAAGYEAGMGQAEIAKEILRQVPDLVRGDKGRAAVIARTETHGAANNGANEAAKELGVAYMREWIAAADKRTRQSHIDAEVQRVGPDEPFIVGGAALMYPGDPNGPPKEVVNCRCCVGFVVD